MDAENKPESYRSSSPCTLKKIGVALNFFFSPLILTCLNPIRFVFDYQNDRQSKSDADFFLAIKNLSVMVDGG